MRCSTREDRYRLLIDLGRKLEPMPDALKTDATKVRGCSASVWVYPTAADDGRLHFLADSNAAITKGIVALVLTAVQDRPADEVAEMDVAAALAPFDLARATERQPHPGRSQHDRAGPRDRPAARGMSDEPTPPSATRRSTPSASSRSPARSATAARSAWNIGAAGDNWTELVLPWREELVGVPDSGILASGAIVSLIDTASGTAVWATIGKFVPMVTLDLQDRLSAPGLSRRNVSARCECVKLTRRIGFTRGTAHVGDPKPIAYSAGTFMIGV